MDECRHVSTFTRTKEAAATDGSSDIATFTIRRRKQMLIAITHIYDSLASPTLRVRVRIRVRFCVRFLARFADKPDMDPILLLTPITMVCLYISAKKSHIIQWRDTFGSKSYTVSYAKSHV
jgi:hypothetical protein